MQARPQDIRDRYNFITNNPDMVNNRVVYPTMRKITDDVGFLLDALQETEDVFRQSIISIETAYELLKQSQDRERVLMEALSKIASIETFSELQMHGCPKQRTTRSGLIAREALKEDKSNGDKC